MLEFCSFNWSNPSIFSFVTSSFRVMLRRAFFSTLILYKYSLILSASLLYVYLCALTFKSLLHLELILMEVIRHRSNIFPPKWLIHYPNIIYLIIQTFVMDLKCHLYDVLSSSMFWGLFLDFIFNSHDLFWANSITAFFFFYL